MNIVASALTAVACTAALCFDAGMTLRIRTKLMLGLLVATALALLTNYALSRTQLRSGMLSYLNAQQDEQYRELVQALVRIHRTESGWDALRRDGRRWAELLRTLKLATPPTQPPGSRTSPPGGPRPARGPEHPRPGPPPFRERRAPLALPALTLLAADGERLIGPSIGPDRGAGSNLRTLPVIDQGEVLGTLHYQPIPGLDALGASAAGVFLAQQQRALLLSLGPARVIAALLAAFLARRFEAPLRALTDSAARLGQGDRATPVTLATGDEFEQLADAFNEMSRALEAESVRRADWLMDVSHELRTPVAILLGEVQALMDGVRSWSPEQGASLEAELRRLQSLLDDFHATTTANRNPDGDPATRIDLQACLKEELERFAPRFAQAQLTLTADMKGDPASFHLLGQAAAVSRVLRNLLENALRYTDAPGTVAVTLTAAEEIHLRIADSPPGVPASEHARLTERFYRLDASRSRAAGGSGLGLAICQRTIIDHGGRLQFSASDLGGLQVDVYFPAA
ncbi:MAG: ATP-binding protein [Pseudomonadota bacterium]